VSSAIDQRGEQIKGARAESDRCAVLEQPSAVGLKLECTKAIAFRRSGKGHCRKGVVSNG
jgi:hypothetical protein